MLVIHKAIIAEGSLMDGMSIPKLYVIPILDDGEQEYLLKNLLGGSPAVYFGVEHNDETIIPVFFCPCDEARSRFRGIARFDADSVFIAVEKVVMGFGYEFTIGIE